MVFVKVRETYDLHTLQDKMTVIGIHTPASRIIRQNYPGLLMQCKGYRPVSCDVKLACASMLPLDPQGIGLEEGDVAPEDVFNPILYKAVSNWSFDQVEQYVLAQAVTAGESVDWNNNGVTGHTDDFAAYYGLLSQTNQWKHANPQDGLFMSNLRPLVYEVYQNVGQNEVTFNTATVGALTGTDSATTIAVQTFRGAAHEMPFMNCTAQTPVDATHTVPNGFLATVPNSQTDVPAPKVYCGVLVVPPSRLHQLFYRMVVEWTLEFSKIRSVSQITSWAGLENVGNVAHIQSYNFSSKILNETTDLVDTSEGTNIKKVM